MKLIDTEVLLTIAHGPQIGMTLAGLADKLYWREQSPIGAQLGRPHPLVRAANRLTRAGYLTAEGDRWRANNAGGGRAAQIETSNLARLATR